MVLAFDTFEKVHGDVVGDWLLNPHTRFLPMLQVDKIPGLLCIVGSREPRPSTTIVNSRELHGFDYSEALLLYTSLVSDTDVAPIDPCKAPRISLR